MSRGRDSPRSFGRVEGQAAAQVCARRSDGVESTFLVAERGDGLPGQLDDPTLAGFELVS